MSAPDITAVVLSARPYLRRFDGLTVHVHQSIIADAKDLQAARFDAIAAVQTPFFFFLDDDDDLPPDYQYVLDRCVLAGTVLAYTDETVRAQGEQGVEESVMTAGPYSQEANLRNPFLVHHLALCRTRDALAAVQRLPRGHYAPELMLYWELAKTGAQYVPGIGYVWNSGPSGMHNWPAHAISMMRSQLWCKANP